MGSNVSRLQSLPGRLAVRLVAAMLAVSLPLLIVLAVLLTTSASAALTDAAGAKGVNLAKAVTLRLEDWLGERAANLSVVAAEATTGLEEPSVAALLAETDASYEDFSLIEITDLTGTVVATSQPGVQISPVGQPWFDVASAGEPAISSLVENGDDIQWIMATPVLGEDGAPIGVVVADLNPLLLDRLLNPELGAGSAIVVVDGTDHLVYDSKVMTGATDDAALLDAGAIEGIAVNPATPQAIRSDRAGAARFVDAAEVEVIGGYDMVPELGWVVIAQDDADLVLLPAETQRNRAILIVALAALLAIVVSFTVAWRTSRPVQRLTEFSRRAAGGDLSVRVVPGGSIELVTLGEAFNQMLSTVELLLTKTATAGVGVNSAAAELSASSEELAATTTQQSAAVTQATATTEELARASAAIAETVDGVARQTAETRDNLEQAEADITLSSERTLALAGKINEIDALRVLINDIADQTNLLALNAAIEAARAGEHGLGFAVVADEVRRLAERSKTSAGAIAAIVTGVQTETTATVLAMEKGAKQMHQGLVLLAAVTDAASEVRLTTQQQRSANAQVVETMEQLTDASRQVSATASQIAAAAGDLANLAGDLELTSAAVSGHR